MLNLILQFSLQVDEYIDNAGSYRIKMYFNSNPYFTNVELVKEVTITRDDDMKEEKTKSTTIDWKDDMNLVQQFVSD